MESSGRPVVLVVDDAEFVRARTARMLAENGYAVIEAVDGADAVQKYRQQRPDSVVLDLTMPVMDGLAALRAIRRFDPQAHVVMITASGGHGAMVEALQAGAAGFVVKPLQRERLLAALARLAA